MQADLAVFIGRFQPFHLGHLHAVQTGLSLAKNVLILIGDTGGPRGLKNPWSFYERRDMILASLTEQERKFVVIQQVYDHPSDTEWMAQVSGIVGEVCDYGNLAAQKVILIGHDKDSSSFYIHCFPQWDFLDTGFQSRDGLLLQYDATAIRKMVWQNELHYAVGILPQGCLDYIIKHKATMPDTYEALRNEYVCIRKYRDSWKAAPFPPVFVTTDCVVVQSGHILLIQRGNNPGKGLWALPGGFIDQAESIEDCAIRELLEETNIKLQPEVLRRCIQSVHVFDRAGGVSEEDRGRIITHVHTIKLDDTKPLPKVKAGGTEDEPDEVSQVKWVLISDIDYREIFSDHGRIIQQSLARLP
jgi:bifunctional NMN adenylyltransferase/nudix hydrolase